jgi:hypothetical protein
LVQKIRNEKKRIAQKRAVRFFFEKIDTRRQYNLTARQKRYIMYRAEKWRWAL